MKISVIVPVSNQESTIRDLLNSLSNLDFPPEQREIVVVDSGSRDKTQQIVQQSHFRLLVEPRKRSSYAARNLGVRESKGEILAFTDGDCIVSRSWLKDLIEGFVDSKVGGVAGTIVPFKPSTLIERFQATVSEPNHKPGHRPLPYAVTANVAYRRQVFESMGTFDDGLASGSDIDFALRMQKSGRYALRFLENAGIVYHRNKRGLRDLMTAVSVKGYGYYHLSRKHPDVFPRNSSKLMSREILSYRRVATEIDHLGKKTILCILGQCDGSALLFELLRVLWQYAWISGVRRAELESRYA